MSRPGAESDDLTRPRSEPGAGDSLIDIFEQAQGLPEDQRTEVLDRLCADRPELRAKIVGMLAAEEQSENFLDRPIVGADVMGAWTEEEPSSSAIGLLQPGTHVGPYRIIRLLDQGGMGAVYLAVRDDDSFSRRVVLKLVRAGMETSVLLERLKAERRILAGLDHPYISRLYDGGSTDDGRPYFVLEYIEGEPIDVHCRTHALSLDERLELFIKVCSVVHFAHQNLVIHRDLKPRNILVTADGDPKLLDFGIAKLINPDLTGGSLDPTDPILRVATPNYASPEQLRGDRVSTRSDIYSLGVLLYKLLTDRLPYSFEGLAPAEIEQRLAHSTPVPPSAVITRLEEPIPAPSGELADDLNHERATGGAVSGLAKDLDAIVLKALRTVARKRYGSAEQMAEDIERFRQGRPVTAHEGNWTYRAGKFLRRHRAAVAAAAGFALVLIGFTIAFGLQAQRVTRERDAAQIERDKQQQVLSLVLELFQRSSPYTEPGQELTVREAVERSVEALDGSLQDQPEVRAQLHRAAGSILFDLGLNDRALHHFGRSLELQQNQYGENHPNLAGAVSLVAAAHKEKGELEQAEKLARHGLELARQAARDTDPETAAGLLAEAGNELVSVLCYQSEYNDAEAPAREALALTANLPKNVNLRIVALEQMARISDAQGHYSEAARLSRESIALRRNHYGEWHPSTLGSLNNLGSSLRRSGEPDAAQQAFDEALQLHRHNFGDRKTSRVLPALLNNSAAVALDRDDLDKADSLLVEALDVVKETMGDSHWLNFHFALRQLLVRVRRQDASAENDLRRLIDRWQPRLGDSWRLDDARSILGESLSRQGRCDEAESVLGTAFGRLLELPRAQPREQTFRRLQDHFQRCGPVDGIAPFAERMAATTGAP